jgi:hypothetical protein
MKFKLPIVINLQKERESAGEKEGFKIEIINELLQIPFDKNMLS